MPFAVGAGMEGFAHNLDGSRGRKKTSNMATQAPFSKCSITLSLLKQNGYKLRTMITTMSLVEGISQAIMTVCTL